MFSTFRAALYAAILTSIIAVAQSFAHGSGDHGTPPSSAIASFAPRAEATSEHYELVAIARVGELAIYLDRLASNEPVEGATIGIETADGPRTALAKAGEPYQLSVQWSNKPGSYDLIVTVAKDGKTDVLPMTLVIPDKSAKNTGATSDFATRSGTLHTLRDQIGMRGLIAAFVGFAAGIVAMLFFRRPRTPASLAAFVAITFIVFNDPADAAGEGPDRDSRGSAAANIRDLAQRLPDGGVFVPKSTQRILALRTVITESAVHRRALELPGRIIPDPNTSGYVQSSVGGRLSPPPGGFPRLGVAIRKGDVLAYIEPPLQAIDLSDMRQRQGELDQQISIVERRLGRYESLAPFGAVARSQLEDTRLELQGLKDRRGSLDAARRAPEQLLAPVDGVIAEGTPVAGQIVQSNAVVFQIVDPNRLWVEARSFDALSAVHRATATLGNDLTVELSFRGSGLADRNQSIPVQFAVQGDVAGLRAGQFVTVIATTNEEKTGLAIPRASLVRNGNGQDVVYEHVSAERFEQRAVRIEPLDGDRVLVATGLTAGKRLVVQGAELLDQIR